MIENAIVFVIVAAAVLWLARRWLPGELAKRRGGKDCKACGDKGCDRCH